MSLYCDLACVVDGLPSRLQATVIFQKLEKARIQEIMKALPIEAGL